MPLYYRDTISFGPFRVNLAKSGLGISVGKKGLRFGTGPRGHYVHAGSNGVYYRKTISGIDGKRSQRNNAKLSQGLIDTQSSELTYKTADGVLMRRIVSSPIDELSSGTLDNTISDLNEARGKIGLSIPTLVVGVGMAIILATAMHSEIAALIALAFTAVGFAIASRADSARLNVVLAYDLDGVAKENYQNLVDALDRLGQSDGLWYVEAAGDITNLVAWKRNSGASHLIEKHPTEVRYDHPPSLQCNVTAPCIKVDGKTLHFMPDCVIVREGRVYGSVPYEDLRIASRQTRFIVDDGLPQDAEVVGQTWKHPNKNGGPDGRFRDNRILPICLFSELGGLSSKGLKFLIMASDRGAISRTETCLNQMAKAVSKNGRESPSMLEERDQLS
ncbi:DUF4236 domain-containing protein [Maritimibacter dapengensis]|uniref:DUF4236 domain-containing protein n=1 Tax=Maritimibacter dapengensis TaxID=2836868 RepID=A0ABS6SWG0_9RHOB|nr:DUF4236 domain-containing protein [Maritimibacter dapengensis]MBV7377289.1 DUF4236 domain-containing protein [Maritimibacter dapengensis]